MSGPVIRQEAAMKQAADGSRTRTETVSRHRSLCCRSCWWLLFLLLVLLMLTTDSAAATCSAKQLRVQQFEDAGAKAYLSPVVFRGQLRQRSPADEPGLYEASFLILQPLKGFTHPQPKKRRRRLQFETPTSDGVACRQGVVAAELRVNTTYLVFAERASQHQFRPLAPPLEATRRHEDAVDAVLCPACKTRSPTVTGLQNVTVRTKHKLKLACQYDGNPLPLIEWYKRGRRIEPTKRTKIVNVYRKRRSVLTIARVSKNDAGKYECKAVSVTDEKVCASAHVTVINEQAPVFPPPISKPPTFQPPRFGENTTLNPSHNPYESSLCPVDSYCLNGGTCLFYEVVGELVCKCAEGYKGKRCENKDFYNRGSINSRQAI